MVTVDQAGKLIGRAGAGIKELRDISGAYIRIGHQCEPGTEMRKITVSGTAEEMQLAETLIQQKLAELNEDRSTQFTTYGK